MRFYTMLMCVDRATFCGDTVERVTGLQDGRFTLQSVKLVSDGALGSSGAALLEDYSDQPGWKGFLLTEEEKWAPLIKKYYDDGWQVVSLACGMLHLGAPVLTVRTSTALATVRTTLFSTALKRQSERTRRPVASAGCVSSTPRSSPCRTLSAPLRWVLLAATSQRTLPVM